MKSLADRFVGKVEKTDYCWNWTAALIKGYGRIQGKIDGKWKVLYAHRVAWELEHQSPFPEGLEARHSCNNRRCVNPAHIIPGTTSENALDAVRAGTAWGLLRDHKLGERNVNSKLTRPEVEEIRCSNLTQQALADKYGVSSHAVWCIKHDRTWRV
jgi:hypothetical protein